MGNVRGRVPGSSMWDMKGVFKDEQEKLIRLVNLAAGSN
jgi:hypothetical protein